jgi:carboxylesterase type B
MQLIFRNILLILPVFCCHAWNRRNDNSSDDGARQSRNDVIVVETDLGSVAGKRGGLVNAFLGIPFAQPPINSLRFRPPVPIRPWHPNLLEAFNFGSECLQSSATGGGGEDDSKVQNEDCLFINIWQPEGAHYESQLPVLLWIYGGAFLHGSTGRPEYIGDVLAAKNVVVVSCNYRLGALGFLVSTADGLYGNYGLNDQKLAMQWVQDHIRNFGGDPDRVTLFGESAGAMSIGLHLLDQHQNILNARHSNFNFRPAKPRKLFHAVILQSNPFGYKYVSLIFSYYLSSDYYNYYHYCYCSYCYFYCYCYCYYY